MKRDEFDRNIDELNAGRPVRLEPHDYAHFASYFARLSRKIEFYTAVNDQVVILSQKPISPVTELFFEKRAAERVRYYNSSNKEK